MVSFKTCQNISKEVNPNKTGLLCPQLPQNLFLWSENWYGNSKTIFQAVNTKKKFP